MESAHAEAACLLIEAGADRTRVGPSLTMCIDIPIDKIFVPALIGEFG